MDHHAFRALLREQLEPIHREQRRQGAQLEQLETSIRGNGRPGLTQRVALLEHKHNEAEQDETCRKADWRAMIGLAIAAGGLLVAALAMFAGG
jgi:hypothetical protein